KQRHPRSYYVIAAGGDKDGVTYVCTSDPLGGVAVSYKVETTVEVPMICLDSLVKTKTLPSPYLIKLDTHGFEVPILEGARETLAQTGIVVMETYKIGRASCRGRGEISVGGETLKR